MQQRCVHCPRSSQFIPAHDSHCHSLQAAYDTTSCAEHLLTTTGTLLLTRRQGEVHDQKPRMPYAPQVAAMSRPWQSCRVAANKKFMQNPHWSAAKQANSSMLGLASDDTHKSGKAGKV